MKGSQREWCSRPPLILLSTLFDTPAASLLKHLIEKKSMLVCVDTVESHFTQMVMNSKRGNK